jgi:DNA polymerase-3 subunit beta
MKFTIDKQDLQANIQHLYNIVPSKNTMPILTNYLIKAEEENSTITFTVTDLEITVIVEFSASVIRGGTVVVSAKNLTDIINSLPDSTVHFIQEEENLRIQCEHSKFNLLCAETGQFPLIPQKAVDNVIELDSQMFKKMIDSTHFAVSNEINRPIFTGIFWKITHDNQLMVATDGKKIAEFKINNHIDIADESDQIIPTKGLLFLDKVIKEDIPTITVHVEPNRVMFSYGNYTIFTHIIEGKFPDYTRAIPANNNNTLIISKTLLKDAVRRVSLMASDDTFKVRFDVSASRLDISSANREEGEANEIIEDIQYQGDPLTIAFNYRYLNAILSAVESKEVKVCMGKATEPALFFNTEQKDDYAARYLLMPLRLN